MSPNSDPRALSEAAAALAERVQVLAERLSVSQRQVERMRWLTVLTAALAVIAVVGGAVSVYLWQEVRATANANQVASVQACHNANQSRAANLRLWTFVLDVSAANNRDRTPRERAQIKQLRAWITELYAPHDCTDLGRSYPIPDPPPILDNRRRAHDRR